jgi:putative hydrolase of the HAD superfamily
VTTRWLLCDYGEVLSQAQGEAEVAAMAELSGVPVTSWHEVYWRHRGAYDRGVLDARAYWEATLEREIDGGLLDELVALDVRSWLHPAEAALEAAARATEAGLRLAVLSNAPHEVADGIDGRPWLGDFSPRLFSARIGITKPDPGIYQAALHALGAAPGDVWFIDDREANVEGAAGAGIHARHYRGDAAVFDEVLRSAARE